jgi:hypothetical protein
MMRLALGLIFAAVWSGRAAAATVVWGDSYRTAYRQAEEAGRQLLVWFEPAGDGNAEPWAGDLWGDPEVQRRMDRFVPLRVTTASVIEEQGNRLVLSKHPAFSELAGGAGLAIVDLADSHGPHFGHVVSVFPFAAGRRVPKDELIALLDLPPGSLTQRTLIFAVRTHPESPRSTSGELLPLLSREAEKHSRYQASIMNQGHHHWEQRFYQLNDELSGGLIAQEVCAESWPGQSLWDAARDCVRSWRHSPGHWQAVHSAHPVYGYDMKRGRNGIWYATGIFADPR